jgi:hypothetical protein
VPFVGAGFSGNPKRLFIGAKDRIVTQLIKDQPTVDALKATKESITQIERYLNTRAVSCKCENPGTTNTTTFTTPTGAFALPVGAPGSVIWDTGTMSTDAAQSIRIPEAGVFQVNANVFVDNTASATANIFFVRLGRFLFDGTLVDSDLVNVQIPAGQAFNQTLGTQFNCVYRDFIRIDGGGATGQKGQTVDLSVTKIADIPSKFGT